jgi:hypothetical protein
MAVARHRKNNSSTSSVDRKAALSSNPSTPDYVLDSPIDRAAREKARKAAIVEAAKARARARRRAESETREQSAAAVGGQDKVDVEAYREGQDENQRSKWEIIDRRAMSPTLIEGHRGHKPGVSMAVVLDSA